MSESMSGGITSGVEQGLGQGLRQGVDALGLALGEAQLQQLLTYQGLIAKWTKVYNLTAVRDPQEMLTHHLLDSLAVVQPLRQHLASLTPLAPARGGIGGEGGGDGAVKRILDVGSGAGLPGVVLAICLPKVQVTCVDTVGKKATFIRQVTAELALPNLTGLHARVESLTAADQDVVISRAFASLKDFTTWSRAAVAKPHGIWLAMKGKHPADELLDLPENVALFHVEQLVVPMLDAERHLLWLRPG